jgi:hypothetical protein
MSDRYNRTLYCGYCKHACGVKWEDHGIGPYEYWGARGVDSQIVAVSDCCADAIYIDPECTDEWDQHDFEEDI